MASSPSKQNVVLLAVLEGEEVQGGKREEVAEGECHGPPLDRQVVDRSDHLGFMARVLLFSGGEIGVLSATLLCQTCM